MAWPPTSETGANRWAAVQRSDAARLVRLGIERASAGSMLHAAGEEGVVMREIAGAIGRGRGLSHGLDRGRERARALRLPRGVHRLDMPVSSAITRELLNWTPDGLGLVADIEAGHYFEARALKY
jgi:hypothetical protein